MLGGERHVDLRADFPGGFPGDERSAFESGERTASEQAAFSHLQSFLPGARRPFRLQTHTSESTCRHTPGTYTGSPLASFSRPSPRAQILEVLPAAAHGQLYRSTKSSSSPSQSSGRLISVRRSAPGPPSVVNVLTSARRPPSIVDRPAPLPSASSDFPSTARSASRMLSCGAAYCSPASRRLLSRTVPLISSPRSRPAVTRQPASPAPVLEGDAAQGPTSSAPLPVELSGRSVAADVPTHDSLQRRPTLLCRHHVSWPQSASRGISG